jgi:transglutaminase-like putative cysteine protease
MRYTVYHLTHFRYDAPVSESVMEVRMQPRTESVQRCLRFELTTSPRSRVFAYQDPEGNVVHHFDVPARHRELMVVAESVVEFVSAIDIPESCDPSTWEVLDEPITRERFIEYLEPSHFARPTEALQAFGREIGLSRADDPLTVLRRLKKQIYDAFEYAQGSTRVDSHIDEALAARRGVCQDFAHVMIALVRGLGIPCRYVSGYLFHNHKGDERSVDGASHAWVEAWLPSLGWFGIDPTNRTLAMDRHIRVAIGRDYHDVPPTRGAFKGSARSELGVNVRVQTTDTPIAPSDVMPALYWSAPEPEAANGLLDDEQEQQQQQQQ